MLFHMDEEKGSTVVSCKDPPKDGSITLGPNCVLIDWDDNDPEVSQIIDQPLSRRTPSTGPSPANTSLSSSHVISRI